MVVLGFWLPGIPGLEAQFPLETVVDSPEYRGITYLGRERVRNAGRSVAHAGDVNHDGRPDVLIGAEGTDAVPGKAYVVLGDGRGPLHRDLPGFEGILELRTGYAAADRLGYFVAAAGDVDGDEIADFLVGMPSEGHPLVPRGGVFLVFGIDHFGGFPNLIGAPSSSAVLFTLSQPRGVLGLAGAGIGDVNGDGFADIALGAPGGITEREPGQPRTTGRLFVVFGGSGLRSGASVVNVDSLVPPLGIEIQGVEAGSELGSSVAGLGDIDGDGTDDFAAGAPGYQQNGSVFVFLGRPGLDQAPDIGAPDGNAVVELRSTFLRSRFGDALGGGADTTGDGLPDLLIGAPSSERDGVPAGAAVLIAGGSALRGTGVRAVPGTRDRVFRGPSGSGSGMAVALVPDLNESGAGEILIGAPSHRGGRGSCYLLYDGTPAGETVFLEGLDEPQGAVFIAGKPDARALGASVAGLPDRNSDRRGDFILGAPGFPSYGVPGSGAAFEVHAVADPESSAPRDLRASLQPGGKVLLTWIISETYRSLRVFRDGAPIEELPGNRLNFTDVAPGAGVHVYLVEANGEARLRSNLADVLVRPLKVRELTCTQLEGSLSVRVTWVPGDVYMGLQVLLDGRPASPILPPHTQSFEVAAGPGVHVIEVFDPVSSPAGERAACRIEVDSPDTPVIQGFTCVLEGSQTVRLTWQPVAAYDVYEILRGGVRIARLPGTDSQYLDQGVPGGPQRYEIYGLNREIHRGPRSACEVLVTPEGQTFLSGRVAWVAGGSVGSGRIKVTDAAGHPVSPEFVQVTRSGEFRAPVTRGGPYRVTYEVCLEPAPLRFSVPLRAPNCLTVTAMAESAAEEVLMEVPPPIFLVSSLGAEEPEEGRGSRWQILRERIGGRAVVFAVVLSQRVARGAGGILQGVEEARSYLREELGSAPAVADIVAFGYAGLSARVYVAGTSSPAVRKFVLLGTPNLGTARGHIEARADFRGRLPRLPGGDGGGSEEDGEQARFLGAEEQTLEFLAHFNQRVDLTRGAEVHLVAGTSGRAIVQPILGCSSHDDRVCEESALGGVPGARLHRVAENHEILGRGAASVGLLESVLFAAGGGGGEEAPAGGGGGVESTQPPGDVYSGVLEPGGTGALPLISDTSESIIIILNSELPGGVEFRVKTPAGQTIDPPLAGALGNVDYQTYGDGEGHEVQVYKFAAAELGIYTALLDNPSDNIPIQYTLEVYVESDFIIEASVEPDEVDTGGTARIAIVLTRGGVPHTGASGEARILRPDGDLVILPLLDDGQGADEAAGDGTYSALATTGSQPGIHEVEVSATETAGPITLYRREFTTRFEVHSDAATFAGDLGSSAADDDADGSLDGLWITGQVEVGEPGVFLITAELTDLSGAHVASGGVLLTIAVPQTASFGIYFPGAAIYSAQRNGPFVVSEITLLDGTAGFVVADRRLNAHQTAAMGWADFGAAPAAVEFIRGDPNADGRADISDGIFILEHLFGGRTLGCRDAANTNDDAALDLTDAVFLFNYLFRGGAVFPAPYPGCGEAEEMGCGEHAACE